jgi:hypothetical protein
MLSISQVYPGTPGDYERERERQRLKVKKTDIGLGMVTQFCNSSHSGDRYQEDLGHPKLDLTVTNKLGVVSCTCNPSYKEGIGTRITG